MRADLTMTVEITEDEAQVLKYALQGLSTERIHDRMRGKFSMRQIRRGLRFAADLDLVQMTHDNEITWDFHEKFNSPLKPEPVPFPASFQRQVSGGS